MKIEKQQSWLTILPYVYISVKKKEILFYNTLNKESIYIKNSDNIKSFIRKIKNSNGINTIIFQEKEFRNSYNKKTINELQEKYMASVTHTNHLMKAPFQLSSKMFLFSDVEKLKDEKKALDFVSYERLNDISKYLNKLFIYINNYIELNNQCQYKLFPSFINSSHYDELSLSSIKLILNQLKKTQLSEVDILGGDIFKHSQINDILILLKEYKLNFILHLFYEDVNLNFIKKDFQYIIHASFPINEEKLDKVILDFKSKEIKYKLNFIISNETDFVYAYNLLKLKNIIDYSFSPVIDGNLNFIKRNMFLSKKEILSNEISMQSIFKNQKLNDNFFGNINIVSNGDIYSNFNLKKIGNVFKNSILDSLTKEFTHTYSWRKTRLSVKPCNTCVFNSICPPISNYEYVLKRFNLCKFN